MSFFTCCWYNWCSFMSFSISYRSFCMCFFSWGYNFCMSAFNWSYRLFCMSFVFRNCRSSFILFIFRRFFCFAITSFFIHIFHKVVIDSFIVFVFFFIFRRFSIFFLIFFTSFWLSRFVFTSFWFGRFWFSRFIFFFTCIFTRGYWCFIFFLTSFCIFCCTRLYSCATIIWFHFFLWP